MTALVLAAGFVLGWLAELGVPGLRGFGIMWPQRWDFFTGMSHNSVVPYRFVGEEKALAPLDEIGWNGLGRAAETRVVQAWQFARLVPDDHWHACGRSNPLDCGLDLDAADIYRMWTGSPDSLLCGKLALSLERTEVTPVGKLPAVPRTVYRIALVDLSCR
ncbi:hypothetical protein [Lentzea atacamensis]|uniref:hypothetical protein n=1 Tax=Lentzea atacamensis TaxID=531938 RepID=UPI0011B67F35|nr:hypothetical protein [Lentzea atacamensis]